MCCISGDRFVYEDSLVGMYLPGMGKTSAWCKYAPPLNPE
jgi:hypothetical protein